MNNLLQQFNDFMNNTNLKTVFVHCMIIGGLLILVGILDRIQNADLGSKTFSRIALTMAGIVLVVGVSALAYTKLPGYVEKSESVDYLDNNGVFGTGNGGVATPTTVSESATYIDPETGETKFVADDGPAGPWAGPDDSKQVSDAPAIPNMEPNDDPGPGPKAVAGVGSTKSPADLPTSSGNMTAEEYDESIATLRIIAENEARNEEEARKREAEAVKKVIEQRILDRLS